MTKDSRGTEIQVGDMVAYNYGGEVHHGQVIDIKDTYRYRRAGKLFIVRSFRGYESKVTSSKNLMVINEVETCADCGNATLNPVHYADTSARCEDCHKKRMSELC